MTKAFFRAVAVAALGALAGAAWTVAFYAARPGLTIDMTEGRLPAVVHGFYAPEKDPAGLTFAWSHQTASIDLAGLDRRSGWQTTVRYRGARPEDVAQPEVTIVADGVVVGRQRATNAYQELRATVPPSATLARGAVIAIAASETFVPGASDPRELGVMVDRIEIAPMPGAVTLPPRVAIGSAAVAMAAFGGALGLVGITAGSAVGAVVVIAAGHGAVAARGAAPYLPYAQQVSWLGALCALALVGVTWGTERITGERLRNTARFVAIFSITALYLKLLVLLHPDMPVGDAVFQAHRFEWVLAGRWLFTSVAPGGYEFPYAIGLYAVAAPFTPFVDGLPALVALLRCVTAVADVAAGLLIYPLVTRSTGDRLAGAVGVALFHLVPLNFQVQTVGNLTNGFAQSAALAALACVGLGFAARPSWAARAATAAAVVLAFLSHTSTFAILLVTLVLTVLLFRVWGGPVIRAAVRPLALIVAAALAVSVLAYYGHFGETYRTQAARITSEMGRPAAESDPGRRTVAMRAAGVPHSIGTYYGWPATLLAIGGAAILRRRRQRDWLALTLVAWTTTCLAFLVLGVLTPVDMRYYLASFPALALLGGVGAAAAWRAGPLWRGVGIVLLAACVVVGVSTWLSPL